MAKEGPGRAIGREMAAGNRADAEVYAFISRRHDRRVTEEGERPAEEAWMGSERREAARRRAENRAGWYFVALAPGGALRAFVGRARGHCRGAVGNRREENGVTEQPDTSCYREYRKTSQECIDAKAQAAGKPSPLMLSASGVGAKAFGIKRPLWTKKAIPNVETKEDGA